VRLYEQLLSRNSGSDARSIGVQEWIDMFSLDGPLGPLMPTTWGRIGDEELSQSVNQAYTSNGPIFALVLARMQVFSQARFQWTRFTSGTPRDLFGTPELGILERPWVGGTTADLLARMEMYASGSGNSFTRRVTRGAGRNKEDFLHQLRPEWTKVVLASNEDADHPADAGDTTVLGYAYMPGGDPSRMIALEPWEVAHYAPIPDPMNNFVGMSWITPVFGEVLADDASEVHKRRFFQNAATPNLAIKFDSQTKIDEVKAFKKLIEDEHKGHWNAYKTMYLGGGADPVVLGKDFKELDFSATQGKGESRLASAAGVPPSWVGFSEGLEGSALNAGNFNSARRRFGDGTMNHLWGAAASALEVILRDRPAGASLWHDVRSVPFLREDAKEHAETQAKQAETIRQLVEAGFTPESAVQAVTESNYDLLKHSGLVSVQLQKPGDNTNNNPAPTTAPPNGADS
jgi:phage portal protein BeeE